MTQRFPNRNASPARSLWLVGVVVGLIGYFFAPSAKAQTGYAPQTNLTPIGPIGGPANYGTAPLSGSLFDPYASPSALQGGGGSAFGNGPMVGLGTPQGYPAPSYTPNYAPPSIGGPSSPNPAYPNGSFLGGLFSGSFFGNGTGSTAGYPSNAAPYTAPPIYNYGAPAGSASPLGGYGSTGSAVQGGFGQSGFGQGGFNQGNFGPSSYGASDPFPSSIYPSGSPTTLFPGGLSSGNGSLFPSPGLGGGGGGGTWNQGTFFPQGLSAYQLLHGPRLRHMFISGGDSPDDLGINQTDVSIGFAFQNFLYSTRPLYVVPSFSLYQFDGPITTVDSPFDLPGSAYGAFLDFGWQSDPNRMIGGELGVRVGAYSDFETFDSDSLRVLGKGLLSFRLTPASTLKGGVYYLGQHSQSILPAGGLLYQPNPYTRLDIFFPEPKIAQYFRTIGTQDVWWYLAGQYDAESWTITRAAGGVERVDLNQIDVMLGLEWGRSDWIRAGQRTGFVEVGVSFERQLDYERQNRQLDLGEAFLVRAGFGY